jgi:uncharacterized PurR-regulated membrane protein YhhQ (DUF165 family)
MRMKRSVGYACLAGFIACIFLANYAIQHWGTVPFPGGPHTVTLLGLTGPSGVLFVGLSFGLRDFAQQLIGPNGKWWTLAAIVVGAGLSYLVAPSLAMASAAAFAISETADWLCWTPLAERGRLTAGLVLSNTVGSALDTLVFLWLAFHSLQFFWGQFWLKALMMVPALVVVIAVRMRGRERRREHQDFERKVALREVLGR